MKILISILAALLSLNGMSQRYLMDEFPILDSIIGGTYGSSIDYQSNTQNLLFDFYEPLNDTATKRPLIIYIHGGGFNSGSRTLFSVREICRRMAKKGYAVANLDYRLDPNFDIYNSATNRRVMTDAMHDAKQAIRFFKANATIYKIDTSLVFIGGESAGAATSMMASFVDKQAEMSSYPMANPNNPVGSTVNSNVGNGVQGTLCLCGLLLDTLAIELPTDPNILWTHGTNDNFIPISLAFNVVLRAANVGLPIVTKVYEGATHCPWYFGLPNWTTYLDSTITDITNFLYPRVIATSGLIKIQGESNVSIYPNPFQNQINIVSTANVSEMRSTIQIFNGLGQTVFNKTTHQLNQGIFLNLEHLDEGCYFILIENDGNRVIKKMIKSW
ncbi:MAG: T9SS type A sorting domain-containing protein [Crocinitomicaceae bacterium]